MIDLLACPFCGGKGVLDNDPRHPDYPFYIECDHCGTSSDNWPTEKAAIAAWNRRAPTPSIPHLEAEESND